MDQSVSDHGTIVFGTDNLGSQFEGDRGNWVIDYDTPVKVRGNPGP